MRPQPTEKAPKETHQIKTKPTQLPSATGIVIQQIYDTPLVISTVSIQYFNSNGAFICFCIKSKRNVASQPNGKVRMKKFQFFHKIQSFRLLSGQ